MQRLNLFAGLAKEEIEAMAGRLHDGVWQRRQLILAPESAGDRIYLVKTSAGRVYQISPGGRELTRAILRPGQLLGTAALAGISQQGAFAEALVRVSVDVWRKLVASTAGRESFSCPVLGGMPHR